MSVTGWRTDAERLDGLENENLAFRKQMSALLANVGELHKSVLETQRMLSAGEVRQVVQEALGAEGEALRQLTSDAVRILRVLVDSGAVSQDALNEAVR